MEPDPGDAATQAHNVAPPDAGGEAVRLKADAAYSDLKERIGGMRSGGATYQEIADSLNDEGHTTQRGKPWTHVAVLRVCKRYGIAA